MVLCPPFPYQVHSFVQRLTATITDLNIAKLLAREAEKQGKKANVHLKLIVVWEELAFYLKILSRYLKKLLALKI